MALSTAAATICYAAKQHSPLQPPLYRKIKVDFPAEVDDILRRLTF